MNSAITDASGSRSSATSESWNVNFGRHDRAGDMDEAGRGDKKRLIADLEKLLQSLKEDDGKGRCGKSDRDCKSDDADKKDELDPRMLKILQFVAELLFEKQGQQNSLDKIEGHASFG